MSNKIVLKSNIVTDKYCEYLFHNYDIQNRECTITEVPLPSQDDLKSINNSSWNIMLICGKSGSGKSTILKHFGEIRNVDYDYDKAVISQFLALNEEEACDLLCGVGLSSVPTWLRRPNELSNGERARLDLCKSIYDARDNDIILVDEFTSVVNRDAAKSMSFALQRYVRQKNLRIILASCHFDIIEWLQPDYIFNLNHRDENGDVDVEHLNYGDSETYKNEQYVQEKDSLSDAKRIP